MHERTLKRAAWAVVATAVVVVGGRLLDRREPAAPSPAAVPIRVEPGGAGASGAAVVHVTGAVRRPGVYSLEPGARVEDALRAAGGATRRADLAAVNLAAELRDGRQVVVPVRRRAGAAGAAGAAKAADAAGGAEATGGETAAGALAAPAREPLDLNTATLDQLDALEGIGPATARQIIEHREKQGGFGSVEELDQVPGIGEKRLAALRELVRV